MSFKRLSIIAVYILVAILLAFYPSSAGVRAAVTQNTLTKRATSITIQDQQIDLNNPAASVNLNLSGNPAESHTFNIPIVITYDDGTTRNLAYVFNYTPPPSVVTPSPSPSPACSSDLDCTDGNPCTNDTCVNGQCSYSNKAEGEVCERDSGSYEPTKTCDANGSCSQSVAGSPSPSPSPSCGDFAFKYAECDWGSQQLYDVYQDSCGSYDRRNYRTETGQCGAGGGGSSCTPNCSEEPNVCSGQTFNDGCGGTCVGSKDCGGGGGGSTCQEADSFNCTGENAGCGPDSGEMKKTTVHSDCSQTFITYCDAACAPGGQ